MSEPDAGILDRITYACCRSSIKGNCRCEESREFRVSGAYVMQCNWSRDKARAIIAECKEPMRDLLLASPNLPDPISGEERERWSRLVEDRLTYASLDVLEMGKDPSIPDHQKDPSVKFILQLWEASREYYDGMCTSPRASRVREIARKMCQGEGHEPDVVVMGTGPHPCYGAKGTAAFTAPIHPQWCLYWRAAETAFAMVEETEPAERDRGFGG